MAERTHGKGLLADWFSLGGRVRNPLALVLLIGVLGTTGGCLEPADGMGDKETKSFDEAVILAMRGSGDSADPIGPPQMEILARDLTALGGVTVLTIVTLVSFGAAVFSGRAKLGWAALAAVILGRFAM